MPLFRAYFKVVRGSALMMTIILGVFAIQVVLFSSGAPQGAAGGFEPARVPIAVKMCIRDRNGTLGPYTAERGYKEGSTYRGQQLYPAVGGGMCKVATTVFNAAIQADLDIVERHTHVMPVNYIPPGRDATIWYGSLDLKIRNNMAGPVLLWADVFGKTLYLSLIHI